LSSSSNTETSSYSAFCGLDVGKEVHHVVALDPAGTRLVDRPLPNDEGALRELFTGLQTHGRVLLVVDQVAAIGALAVAVARDLGVAIGYLPGLTMRRLADLHPGEGKTDARDAFVIADAARSLPHTLRRVDGDDEQLAELTVLAGYDNDLAAEVTRLTNRLHDALTHVHPALERLIGRHLNRAGVLDLLVAAPTPAQLQRLSWDDIAALLRPRSRRLAAGELPGQILTALTEQTVTVPGTDAFGRVIAGLARQLRQVRDERDSIVEQLEQRLDAHPLAEVLTSMPGIGVRTAINILVHVGDGSAFPTAAHLAAYAGLAPVTPPVRLVDPRRDPLPTRQQGPQGRPVLVGIRQSARPSQPGLLRQEASRRQEAQCSAGLPRPPPHRRHPRHDPHPHPLPAAVTQPDRRRGCGSLTPT